MSDLSGAYELSANIPISKNISVHGILPFSFVDIEYQDTERTLGSVYLGLQTRNKSYSRTRTNVSIGIYLPTTSGELWKFNNRLGRLANFNELEKYRPASMVLIGVYAIHYYPTNYVKIGAEVGPRLHIPTIDDGRDINFASVYRVGISYQVLGLATFAELHGSVEIVHYYSTNHLNCGIQINTGAIHPGVLFKYYLDNNFENTIDGVLGVYLECLLR